MQENNERPLQEFLPVEEINEIMANWPEPLDLRQRATLERQLEHVYPTLSPADKEKLTHLGN